MAGRLAGRLASRAQAPNLPWAAQVVSWMDLVDLCRELDESIVAAGPVSSDTLELHAAITSLAVGSGTWLLQQIRANHADISASGHSVEVLDASLDLVKILHRSRHPEFSASEIEAVQRRIFNAATCNMRAFPAEPRC